MLTSRSGFWRKATFAVMMIAFGVTILGVITAYPLWLTGLVFLILGIFIFLNRKFYAFFNQKRGMMFAIAVIPFHMLYFLYSVTAFILGTILYYSKAGVAAAQVRGKS
jgi:hypothetical protein